MDVQCKVVTFRTASCTSSERRCIGQVWNLHNDRLVFMLTHFQILINRPASIFKKDPSNAQLLWDFLVATSKVEVISQVQKEILSNSGGSWAQRCKCLAALYAST